MGAFGRQHCSSGGPIFGHEGGEGFGRDGTGLDGSVVAPLSCCRGLVLVFKWHM
jgi:hypothetical protein